MSNEQAKPRDPNQPFPKPQTPGIGATILKLIAFGLLLLVLGTMILYSLQIQVWPWAWTHDNWTGYLTFSQEKAQNVEDRIASYDWANLKTKVTDKTKELWTDAPIVGRAIEEKLARLKGAPAAGGAPPPGAPPAGAQPASGAPTPEHQLALQCMRDGISHYRKSPDDPSELLLAKKSFEDAQGHFVKALKETQDDASKSEIQQELTDCNKYLEDCRAREKS